MSKIMNEKKMNNKQTDIYVQNTKDKILNLLQSKKCYFKNISAAKLVARDKSRMTSKSWRNYFYVKLKSQTSISVY